MLHVFFDLDIKTDIKNKENIPSKREHGGFSGFCTHVL